MALTHSHQLLFLSLLVSAIYFSSAHGLVHRHREVVIPSAAQQHAGFKDFKIGRSKLPPSPYEAQAKKSSDFQLNSKNHVKVSRADMAALLQEKIRVEAAARKMRTFGNRLHHDGNSSVVHGAITGADPAKAAAGSRSTRGGSSIEPQKENNYQIKYFGGPVVWQPINLYVIYYGTWYQSEVNIIETFIKSISSSSYSSEYATVRGWWKKISSQYYQVSGSRSSYVTNTVRLSATAFDKYSTSSIIKSIEKQIKTTKRFPLDSNGIYMVLTSADVEVSVGGMDFCGSYCGVRTSFTGTVNGVKKRYQYIHVGNPIRQCQEGSTCILGWRGKYYKTPNGNWGVDSMIGTIGHELAEAATEPDGNLGWHDETEMEVGDKCAYDLGANVWVTNKNTKNSYIFNTVGLNGVRFLQEAIWKYSPKSCVVQ
ncbi:hypothetical protein CLOM_g19066 [Closterium sp. NIES-68]|nr:hypothetical protein CLOM_g19066 [Closterium sp. NIES-68]GJP62347.1 hypothetical protein CLOP_g19425 [Closterium sp. NIES-67]